MEEDVFLNKIKCEFLVITHDTDCKVVTEELGIKPNRCFNKGDKVFSKYSTRTIYRPHGLWAIQSGPIVSEEVDVSWHIKYFEKLLSDKTLIINKFKIEYGFECVFSIDVETEDAGVGFDFSEEEINFIQKISSRYNCHFMCKEKIER